MPIYMKIEGVEGDVTAPGYERWHEVLSFSWGESNSSSAGPGGGSGAGKVSMSDLNTMMLSGKGQAQLMFFCASGRLLPAVQMEVAISREGVLETFQRWTLNSATISSFQTSGAGGEKPINSLSMNFTKIKFEQAVENPNGQVRFQTMTWDLARNSGNYNP